MWEEAPFAPKVRVVVTMALGCLTVGPAWGQDREAGGAAAQDRLVEIVVTAQKRAQNLQQVPIAVRVVGSQALAQQNINSLVDMAEVEPSLHFVESGRSNYIFVRGIGTEENQSLDQKVGTFIDDVYHGRSRNDAATFLDLDRIEILKGPQSTFFGNNAIAGALNIVTKKPGNQLEAWARALYGENAQYAVEGAAGGPVNEVFGLRAAATFNGMDGWVRNENTGKERPNQNNMAGRATFVLKPNADLEAILKFEGGRNRADPLGALQIINCPPPAPFPVAGTCATALTEGLPTGADGRRNSRIAGEGNTLSVGESVLTVNYTLGHDTLTSVTGFYNYHYSLDLAVDPLPETTFTAEVPENYHQFSQEFRIASPTGRPIEYVAGGYVQTDELAFRQDLGIFFLTPLLRGIGPLAPYLPLGQELNFRQGEHSYSVFGSASWNASDRLKVTAGLRGSWVNKSYNWGILYGTASQTYGGIVPLPDALQAIPGSLGLGVPTTLSGDRGDHAWMPSGGLQYQLTPQAMLYLSYSRGFKAGGFNGTDPTGNSASIPFDPEYVNAYEAGLKSEWLNDRLLMSFDVFRSNYSDLQVSTNTLAPGTGQYINQVKNAAAARSQGVELEGQWLLSQDFRLSANATYLDSYYISYANASPTQLQTLLGIPIQDLSGKPTEYAPKWAGTITGTYSKSLLGAYRFIVELSGFASSEYFIGASIDDALERQPGYARLDGRLALETGDGRWAVDLIGKNLTDHLIYSYISGQLRDSPGSQFATIEQPRNVAIQVRFRW